MPGTPAGAGPTIPVAHRITAGCRRPLKVKWEAVITKGPQTTYPHMGLGGGKSEKTLLPVFRDIEEKCPASIQQQVNE